MGIYIPGMKMPKACVYRENGHFMTCPLYDIDGYCGVLHKEAKHDLESKLCDCPLVLVPPHGDLIDKRGVDILSWHDGEYGTDFEDGVLFVLNKLDELPVIIPAEESEV